MDDNDSGYDESVDGSGKDFGNAHGNNDDDSNDDNHGDNDHGNDYIDVHNDHGYFTNDIVEGCKIAFDDLWVILLL